MKRIVQTLVLVVMAFSLAACRTTGLSSREAGRMTYTNYLYSFVDEQQVSDEKIALKVPMKLAVAQIGETAPPEWLMAELSRSGLFVEIHPVPVFQDPRRTGQEEKTVKENMESMKKICKTVDADYLFVFGGNADYGATSNIFELLDFTIVGAYIIPSKNIMAEGKASGSLIHVESGRVVFNVSDESKRKSASPTMVQEGQTNRILSSLRQDLIESLAEKLVNNIRQYPQKG